MFIKLIMTITLLTSSLVLGTESKTKQQRWDAMAKEVSHWVDAQDTPIDSGIMDTVIALNMLGLVTMQSCEGHLYPGVSFLIGPKELWYQIGELARQWREYDAKLNTLYPHLSEDERYFTPEGIEMTLLDYDKSIILEKINKAIIENDLTKPISSLIDAFYETHFCSDDEMLVVNQYVLMSAGANLQPLRTKKEQADKLLAYQNEMRAFTQFLKGLIL